jgi:hypothetical protein
MSDSNPASDQPNEPASNSQPVYQDWRDVRRAERQQWREQRRAWRRSGEGAWIGGAVLILLGVIFLLQNLNGFRLDNWWALFILIPAVVSLTTAWNLYHQTGQLTRSGRSALLGGLVLLLITAVFLFNLNWNLFLPLLLILLGLGMLLNSLLPG